MFSFFFPFCKSNATHGVIRFRCDGRVGTLLAAFSHRRKFFLRYGFALNISSPALNWYCKINDKTTTIKALPSPESWIFLINISLTTLIKLVNVDIKSSVSRVLPARNTYFNQSHDFIYDFSSEPEKKCWKQNHTRKKISSVRERCEQGGFEPALGDPNGCQVQRLNHSAITAKSGNAMSGIGLTKRKKN